MFSRSYKMPLQDWIVLALSKKTLEETLDTIRNRRPPAEIPDPSGQNAHYINKILDEEITRQFRNRHRPLVEVVTNAIDARLSDTGGNRIDIRLKYGGHFECEDYGRSMDLEQLLTMLIIPFSTEKDIGKDIGRFGVGFLSTLNYCLRNSDSEVEVTARTEKESYVARFYATSRELSDLMLEIKPSKKGGRQGTKVKISYCISDKSTMREYLVEQVGNFSRKRAEIRLNGKIINPEFVGDAYYSPQKFVIRDREVEQEVGVIIDPFEVFRSMQNGTLHLTSQGIKVEDKPLYGANAKIDFPPAVLLVEGRDEFKLDGNYFSAIDKVFEMLAVHIARKGNEKLRVQMRNTVASLAGSIGINDPKSLPHRTEIMRGLFGNAAYILPEEEYRSFIRFFGKEAAESLTHTGPIGFPFWSRAFRPGSEYLDANVTKLALFKDFDEAFPAQATGGRHSLTPNFGFLVQRFRAGVFTESISELYHSKIVECEAKTAGDTPFLHFRGETYMNVSHPIFKKEDVFRTYAVAHRFLEQSVPIESIEDHLGGYHRGKA